MSETVKWACPKCGAPPNGHGKGVCKQDTGTRDCEGFLCECANDLDDEEHGDTAVNPCPEANCYHCNWGGVFPPPPFDLKKLPKWARTAWEAGWRPPVGWQP